MSSLFLTFNITQLHSLYCELCQGFAAETQSQPPFVSFLRFMTWKHAFVSSLFRCAVNAFVSCFMTRCSFCMLVASALSVSLTSSVSPYSSLFVAPNPPWLLFGEHLSQPTKQKHGALWEQTQVQAWTPEAAKLFSKSCIIPQKRLVRACLRKQNPVLFLSANLTLTRLSGSDLESAYNCSVRGFSGLLVGKVDFSSPGADNWIGYVMPYLGQWLCLPITALGFKSQLGWNPVETTASELQWFVQKTFPLFFHPSLSLFSVFPLCLSLPFLFPLCLSLHLSIPVCIHPSISLSLSLSLSLWRRLPFL